MMLKTFENSTLPNLLKLGTINNCIITFHLDLFELDDYLGKWKTKLHRNSLYCKDRIMIRIEVFTSQTVQNSLSQNTFLLARKVEIKQLRN